MPPTDVAVFNDTSFGRHFGCDAVMDTIHRKVGEHGGRIIHAHPVKRPWEDDAEALAALERAAVVIVNGEGTIHHGSEKAGRLARLGPWCAQRGRPCYLINATLQANDAAVMEALAAFDHIWVRETASAGELGAAGVAHTICGDLSLDQPFARAGQGDGQVVVIDSVQKKKNRYLAQLAAQQRAAFVSMKYSEAGGLAYRRAGWLRRRYAVDAGPTRAMTGVRHFNDFARWLGGHGYLITGRFHAFCFAVTMGLPVSVLPSNTWKSEAMLGDIGLDARRVIDVDAADAPAMRPFSAEEQQRLANYLAATRQGIHAMFGHMLDRAV